MDPKIKFRFQISHNFKEESNSSKLKPNIKNPLEKSCSASKKQIIDQAGDESAKNIKSEVANQFNGKLNSGSKRPPPPKYPAPMPPLGSGGTSPPPNTHQLNFPSDIDLGKPPPHPTPPPDLPSAADLGKPMLRPEGSQPDFPPATKMDNFSHLVVDTKVYPPDMLSITITGDQKIPYRENPKISRTDKENLAAKNLVFDADTQDDFYKKVGADEKTLALINECKLTEKEAAAIHAYTKDEYYVHINSQFRHLPLDKVDISDAKALTNAGVQNPDLAELIAALIKGMRKLPPAQTSDSAFLPLGRSVEMYKEELDLYVKDAEIISRAFLSTTDSATAMVSVSVGFWDKKDIALIIYQRVNGNARDIGRFSEFPDEQEILFMPNTKFKVMFRSEPRETEGGASAEEVAALKALSNQEEYEMLKSKADNGDEEAKEALRGREYANELSYQPGVATQVKNNIFESGMHKLTKTFISIMEIPLDSSGVPGS